MRTLPGFFLFVFVLLSGGVCLECEVCSSPGGNCIGEKKLCDDNQDTCAIISIENSIENVSVLLTAKDCESSEVCMSPGKSMNLGGGRIIQSLVTCCIKDFCAVESPKIEALEIGSNGLKCRGCYSTSNHCGPEMINCTGDHNHCFQMISSTVIGKKVVNATMMGCTTRSTCLALEEGKTSHMVGSVKEAECTPRASRASPTSILLFPTFSGIVMVKTLL